MLEKYEDLIPLPSNRNWRGNKAVFPHTLSSELLMLSRFSIHLYNYMLWHQSLLGLSETAPGTSPSHLCRLQEFASSHPSFCPPAGSRRRCVGGLWSDVYAFLSQLVLHVQSDRDGGKKKSFFPLKYETAGRVWQPSCASEHLGCILTVLNIRGIDSGIRCTPLPRPLLNPGIFQKWE